GKLRFISLLENELPTLGFTRELALILEATQDRQTDLLRLVPPDIEAAGESPHFTISTASCRLNPAPARPYVHNIIDEFRAIPVYNTWVRSMLLQLKQNHPNKSKESRKKERKKAHSENADDDDPVLHKVRRALKGDIVFFIN
ncbi:hypothetical protein C0J52_26853, partial [Blattella germanica]